MSQRDISKIMKKRKKDAVKFEDYTYSYIRRNFQASLGWNIEQERTLKDGKRVDYSLSRVKYGKKERAVVEVKNVTSLAKYHIDQLDHYSRKYHATYRLVLIPSKTNVEESVKEYAKDLSIEIVRLHYP